MGNSTIAVRCMRVHCLRFLLLGPAGTSTEVEWEIRGQCASQFRSLTDGELQNEVKYCNSVAGWRGGLHPYFFVIGKGDP